MSTLRVNSLLNAAGTDTPAIDGLAKAWVNFNGQGTVAIRAAFNVSTVTDNGSGDYTVNFTTAMVDASYAVSGIGHGRTGVYNRHTNVQDTPTTSTVRIQTDGVTGLYDRDHVFVVIHR